MRRIAPFSKCWVISASAIILRRKLFPGLGICHPYLKIPPSRLWVTVFRDDDEAFEIWRQTGVPEKQNRTVGRKRQFLGPAGNSGPCGPCTEIHYDLGEKHGCGKPTANPAATANAIQNLNLVFTQFYQDESGKRTNLPKPNIDTGMGLERLLPSCRAKPRCMRQMFLYRCCKK